MTKKKFDIGEKWKKSFELGKKGSLALFKRFVKHFNENDPDDSFKWLNEKLLGTRRSRWFYFHFYMQLGYFFSAVGLNLLDEELLKEFRDRLNNMTKELFAKKS